MQIDEIVGKLKKDGIDTEISYRAYSEKIKLSCEKIIKNLVSIIIIIYRNIDGPTTMMSTALNKSCKIPDNIKGMENEINLSKTVPLHMSISYLFLFTAESTVSPLT